MRDVLEWLDHQPALVLGLLGLYLMLVLVLLDVLSTAKRKDREAGRE